jgi:hypothetical protein
VEDILKTLESDALRKLREDELNELEAQGIGEDLYIILREIARRVFFLAGFGSETFVEWETVSIAA